MFLRALDEAGLEPIAHRITPEGPRADLSLDTERLLRRCEQRLAPASGQRERPAPRCPSARSPPPGFARLPHDVRDRVDPAALAPLALDGAPASGCRRSSTSTASSAAASPRERLRVLPGTIDFDRFHADAPPVELGEHAWLHVRLELRLPGPQGLGRAAARVRARVRGRGGRDAPAQGAHDPHLGRGDARRRVVAELRRTGVPEARLPHVRIMAEDLPEADLPGLYTAADAYVSPTPRRGLGPAADGGAGLRRAGHRVALERAAGVPRRRRTPSLVDGRGRRRPGRRRHRRLPRPPLVRSRRRRAARRDARRPQRPRRRPRRAPVPPARALLERVLPAPRSPSASPSSTLEVL